MSRNKHRTTYTNNTSYLYLHTVLGSQSIRPGMPSANWLGPITPRQVQELAIMYGEMVEIVTMGRTKPIRISHPRGHRGETIRTKTIMIMYPSKIGHKPNITSNVMVGHPCVTSAGVGGILAVTAIVPPELH